MKKTPQVCPQVSYWNPDAEPPDTVIPSAHTQRGRRRKSDPSLNSFSDLLPGPPVRPNQWVQEFVGAGHSLRTRVLGSNVTAGDILVTRESVWARCTGRQKLDPPRRKKEKPVVVGSWGLSHKGPDRDSTCSSEPPLRGDPYTGGQRGRCIALW